jgi:hypothetical protein
MPYPESCPECGSTFRNTGTHFTARRNEVGRHVLLELGCQNTTRRFWWDFTTGSPTDDGRPNSARRAAPGETVNAASANNGALHTESNGTLHIETNGRATLSTLDLSEKLESASSSMDLSKDLESMSSPLDTSKNLESSTVENRHVPPVEPELGLESLALEADMALEPILSAHTTHGPQHSDHPEPDRQPQVVALPGPPPPVASASLKDAFLRQLQLDRLTLRQMRSWLMSDEARRAIEVAAGATEGTYERLALILFGTELPQLLGKQSAAPQSTGMSAEERLELQREKARIRARLRRAAAKAARN